MKRAVLVALATLLAAAPARAHPIHSTITELTEDRAHGTVRAMIRVFSDDYHSVLARTRLDPVRYIATAFTLSTKDGRTVALRSCGVKEVSGVAWVCVEADSREGLAALNLRANVLCDLYEDQINVVQATIGGARRSYLFTRGAKARSLA